MVRLADAHVLPEPLLALEGPDLELVHEVMLDQLHGEQVGLLLVFLLLDELAALD